MVEAIEIITVNMGKEVCSQPEGGNVLLLKSIRRDEKIGGFQWKNEQKQLKPTINEETVGMDIFERH